MLTFQKTKWEDIPEALRKRVLNWSDKEVTIDDIGLTQAQIDKVTTYMQQEGFKAV